MSVNEVISYMLLICAIFVFHMLGQVEQKGGREERTLNAYCQVPWKVTYVHSDQHSTLAWRMLDPHFTNEEWKASL